MKTSPEYKTVIIPDSFRGLRLDQALHELLPDYSRSRLQTWIRQGCVTVNQICLRPRDVVKGGESVDIKIPHEPVVALLPQEIPLAIVYEDDEILVINKQAGLVAHPGAGNPDGTLVNALLHHDPQLANLPRAGLIHRLDKGTTGLLVIARTYHAHQQLVDDLSKRIMTREYDAITVGALLSGGEIELAIGRHPSDRQRMAVVAQGREAKTSYRIVEKFRWHTWIKVRLFTGRTHQIRVHMAHLRYPLVGDSLYGGRLRLPPAMSPALRELLTTFPRQALHASHLALVHPVSREQMAWQVPLPEDLQSLTAALRMHHLKA